MGTRPMTGWKVWISETEAVDLREILDLLNDDFYPTAIPNQLETLDAIIYRLRMRRLQSVTGDAPSAGDL